jgi:hypothetical protein
MKLKCTFAGDWLAALFTVAVLLVVVMVSEIHEWAQSTSRNSR